MTKILNYLQTKYHYTNYQIALIKYTFLTFLSDITKLILIFAFFIYIGKFSDCLVALAALIFIRRTGGGFHCEHYITCFLFSFFFLSIAVLLAAFVHPQRLLMIAIMILCIVIAYKLVPIISTHRLEPTPELIKRSRILNFTFLLICLFAVIVFAQNHYCQILFWVCVLHTIQLIIPKFDKGGKYYVT